MAIYRQILCDHCGNILSGREKLTQVNRPHIWMQGRMAYEEFDEKRSDWCYTFVTPPGNEQIAFCDFECLRQFSEAKKKYWEESRAAAAARGADPALVNTEGVVEETDEPSA